MIKGDISVLITACVQDKKEEESQEELEKNFEKEKKFEAGRYAYS